MRRLNAIFTVLKRPRHTVRLILPRQTGTVMIRVHLPRHSFFIFNITR